MLRRLNYLNLISDAFYQPFVKKLIPYALVNHNLKKNVKIRSKKTLNLQELQAKNNQKNVLDNQGNVRRAENDQKTGPQLPPAMVKRFILRFLNQKKNLKNLDFFKFFVTEIKEQNPLDFDLRDKPKKETILTHGREESEDRLMKPYKLKKNEKRPNLLSLDYFNEKEPEPFMVRSRARRDRDSKIQQTLLPSQDLDPKKKKKSRKYLAPLSFDKDSQSQLEASNLGSQRNFEGIVVKRGKNLGVRRSIPRLSFKM